MSNKNDVEALRNQLSIARNEINNLRQQVKNLTHIHRIDVNHIKNTIERLQGQTYQIEYETAPKECIQNKNATPAQVEMNNQLELKPIGVIKTSFPEKRAVPRQASVCNLLKGVVHLHSDFFTNPEHSLEGLEEFSHMWLIYYFNRNKPHPKAKVAPPRLEGQRVGVFSTRSPHRPCPIGLSLVEIDKIEGSTVSFFGTDMINDTPLLDMKPYVPFYDAPFGMNAGLTRDNATDFYGSRQEPDGEESGLEMLGAVGTPSNNAHSVNMMNNVMTPGSASVKVPNWVSNSHRLTVQFNERAESQLGELQVNRQCIIDILEADPRSVYLRTRYGSQIFTFQLSEVTVTCKFDDKAALVTVVQIRRTESLQNDIATSSATDSLSNDQDCCSDALDSVACNELKNPPDKEAEETDEQGEKTGKHKIKYFRGLSKRGKGK